MFKTKKDGLIALLAVATYLALGFLFLYSPLKNSSEKRAMFEAKCVAAGGLVFTGTSGNKCIKPDSEIKVD